MAAVVEAGDWKPEGSTADLNSPLFRFRASLEAAAAAGDEYASALLRFEPEFVAALEATEPCEPAQALAQARADFDVGAYSRGAGRLLPLVAAEATAVAALAALALADLELDRLGDAAVLLARALALDPHHPHALRLAGQCEWLRGRFDEAKLHLAKAARIARKLPEFVADLRIAQRLLLKIQFRNPASEGPAPP